MTTTTHPAVDPAQPTGGLTGAWTRTRLLTGRQVARAVGRRPDAVLRHGADDAHQESDCALQHPFGDAVPLRSDDDVPLRSDDVALRSDDDHDGERGMATAEYAIATVAAAGFAGLLVVILRSGEVRELLLGIIRSALSL
jgi:hypothetical protein